MGHAPDWMRQSYGKVRKMADGGVVSQIESNLRPGERSIVDYHRGSIANKTFGRDEEGRPITVYSTTVKVLGGKHAGKYTTVPGWFDGKLNDDEDVVRDKWQKEIDNDKWPVYDDPKDADDRAKYIHGIMDEEADQVR